MWHPNSNSGINQSYSNIARHYQVDQRNMSVPNPADAWLNGPSYGSSYAPPAPQATGPQMMLNPNIALCHQSRTMLPVQTSGAVAAAAYGFGSANCTGGGLARTACVLGHTAVGAYGGFVAGRVAANEMPSCQDVLARGEWVPRR